MRHDPASAAIIIMLRSLKMHGMAQAVGELTEQGSPAFEAALPILSQLLKADDGRQGCQINGLSAQGRPLSELSRSRRLRLRQQRGPATRRSHVSSIAATFWKTPTMSSWSAAPARARRISPRRSASRPSSPTFASASRFFSTIELVNALEQEKRQGKPGQIAARLLTHSDLGHPRRTRLPPVQQPQAARLLFHLLSKLYESAPASSSRPISALASGPPCSATRR